MSQYPLGYYVRFCYPDSSTVAAEARIESRGPDLPYTMGKVTNQVVSEAISGVVVAAELGDPRQILKLTFSQIEEWEYEDLWNFLDADAGTWSAQWTGVSNPQTGGIKWGLRGFELQIAKGSTVSSYQVRLAKDPSVIKHRGKRYTVEMDLIEVVV